MSAYRTGPAPKPKPRVDRPPPTVAELLRTILAVAILGVILKLGVEQHLPRGLSGWLVVPLGLAIGASSARAAPLYARPSWSMVAGVVTVVSSAAAELIPPLSTEPRAIYPYAWVIAVGLAVSIAARAKFVPGYTEALQRLYEEQRDPLGAALHRKDAERERARIDALEAKHEVRPRPTGELRLVCSACGELVVAGDLVQVEGKRVCSVCVTH